MRLEKFPDLLLPACLRVLFPPHIVAAVRRLFCGLFAAALALLPALAATAAEPSADKAEGAKVVIIPVRTQIDKPQLYILRRGLKQAIENEVDTIVLDMDTPGGALDVTFDILLALEKFPGKTVTYVNREATFRRGRSSRLAPTKFSFSWGIIGSSEPVLSTGGEILVKRCAQVRQLSQGSGALDLRGRKVIAGR